MHEGTSSPLVASVVIATYNRAPFVARALEALLALPGLPETCEVLVVDNNSPDDTRTVVAAFVERHPCVRYILEPRQGVSHARNRGVAEARAAFVAFLDDDAYVQPTWFEALQSVLRDYPEARVIGGPIYPDFPKPPPRWFDPTYVTRTFREGAGPLQGLRARLGFPGGNLTVEKALFEEVGGFDPTLGMFGSVAHYGEEPHLCFRIYAAVGNVTYNHPDFAVWHHEPPQKMTGRYVSGRIFDNAALFFAQSQAALGTPRALALSLLKAAKQGGSALLLLPAAPWIRYGWFRTGRAFLTAAGVLRGIFPR